MKTKFRLFTPDDGGSASGGVVAPATAPAAPAKPPAPKSLNEIARMATEQWTKAREAAPGPTGVDVSTAPDVIVTETPKPAATPAAPVATGTPAPAAEPAAPSYTDADIDALLGATFDSPAPTAAPSEPALPTAAQIQTLPPDTQNLLSALATNDPEAYKALFAGKDAFSRLIADRIDKTGSPAPPKAQAPAPAPTAPAAPASLRDRTQAIAAEKFRERMLNAQFAPGDLTQASYSALIDAAFKGTPILHKEQPGMNAEQIAKVRSYNYALATQIKEIRSEVLMEAQAIAVDEALSSRNAPAPAAQATAKKDGPPEAEQFVGLLDPFAKDPRFKTVIDRDYKDIFAKYLQSGNRTPEGMKQAIREHLRSAVSTKETSPTAQSLIGIDVGQTGATGSVPRAIPPGGASTVDPTRALSPDAALPKPRNEAERQQQQAAMRQRTIDMMKAKGLVS